MKTGFLIVNEGAGGRGRGDATRVAEEVRRALADEYELTVRLATGTEIPGACEEARVGKPDAVLVGGGDGTVSAAAGALVDTNIALGVLPLGTLNHFARDIGLSPDWREALAALKAGRVARIDVGELNGRIFINNCSLGAYPEAVRRRDMLRRNGGFRKWPAMVLAVAAEFWRLRRLRLRGVVPDEHRAWRTPFLVVANNRYSGHVFSTSLRDRLDAGQLWVYTTRAHRHLSVLRLAWQTLVRRIDVAETLDNWPVRDITITPERPGTSLPVALDGEVVKVSPPLRVRIRPGALGVFAGPMQSVS